MVAHKRFQSREAYEKWRTDIRRNQKNRMLLYLKDYSKTVANVYQRRIQERIERFVIAEKLHGRVHH